ncbi:MAG: DUF456 domain-containing protein [Planctomycetes bacterium]|nr:DUF456 domain-containing protein [Planctomycetota bacterium]MBL7107381.1 DUF456 domain-containing protein [Phycisphaerae bacterium]
MVYFFSVLLIFLNSVWLGLVFFALPGNWLIVIGTAAFAWWRWDDGVISIYTLILIAVIAVLGEVAEFFGSFAGAKKTGASLLGSISAIVGAVGGAVFGTFLIPIPFLGTIMGACIGAGILTWSVEFLGGRHPVHSLRSGFGAGFGELIGILSKFVAGCLIWLIVAIAVFWP